MDGWENTPSKILYSQFEESGVEEKNYYFYVGVVWRRNYMSNLGGGGGRVRARQSFIPSSLKYFLILIQLLNSRSVITFKFGTIQVYQSTSLGLDEV